MPRQELANTFSDGLMMDLNPINTPKSVLTDCLNGTYITYNGNEFVLQNDMGNYKLKNCKLPTNFIPVGVKGYADILYIVSYNPFTKEVEIGSYPAPQSIFSAGDTESEFTDDDLSPFKWEDGINEYEYPTIIKEQKKPLFIFTDTNEETFKLYPGDEFKFTADKTGLKPLEYYYQHLNFYVIDEDNKLYDLDDTLIYNIADNGTVSLVSNDMRKVFWETPGWLAAQYDLYVPDKFNLNLRSLNVPEFLLLNSNEPTTQAEGDVPLDKKEPAGNQFKVSMDLSSQITITDLLFQAELNKPVNVNTNGSYQDLYVRYLIKTADPTSTPNDQKSDYGLFQGITYTEEGKTESTDIITTDGTETNENGTYSYFDIHVWPHNYQDDVITAFNNIRPIWFYEKPSYDPETETFDVLNYKGVVEITAYPIIKQHTNKQILKFTQFSTTQRFPLNTLKNSKDIFVANSIYKWSVDNDSCTVSFNIDGPFINASDITGRYEIYRINLFNTAEWPNLNKTPDLDNPESYSKWTNTKVFKLTTEEITNDENESWTNDSWGTGLHYTELTNQKKLLMCKGNISNLVLYGQNTLNIDWNNSNEIILNGYQNRYTNPDFDSSTAVNSTTNKGYVDDSNYDGSESSTKTINFSKEGGIYIFRVILEQNGSTLNTTDKILIPSEVFNEWFGSIDNYDNIYLNQWIERYKNFLNISTIELFNAKVNIYKSNSQRLNNEIVKLNNKNLPRDYNNYQSVLKTFTDITGSNHLSKTQYSQTWPVSIDYIKLIDSINLNTNYSSSKLNGNLWNSKIASIFVLKQSGQEICQIQNIEENIFKLVSFISLEEQQIIYNGSTSKIKEKTSERLFPTTSQMNYVSISSDLENVNTTNPRNKHYTQWNYRNNITTSETPIGNGVWTYKNGITYPNNSYFGDPLSCFGTKYHVNVARFRIKSLAHVNKGWSCALCYGGGGGDLNTGKIINYGEQSSDSWYNNGNSRFLVFRAANKASNTDYNGICIVDFGNNSTQHSAALSILSRLYLNTYGNDINIYAIKITNTLSLNNKNSYTINKIDLKNTINLLRVDDIFLTYSSKMQEVDNININSNLLLNSTEDFNNITEQYNLSTNQLLLEFNWTQNEDYNTVYLHFNSELEEYNAETDRQISSSTEQLEEITLSGEDTLGISQSIIKKLTGQNGEKLTIDNVAWDNNTGSYMIMYNSRDGHSGTNPTDHTGKTYESFIEEFTTS